MTLRGQLTVHLTFNWSAWPEGKSCLAMLRRMRPLGRIDGDQTCHWHVCLSSRLCSSADRSLIYYANLGVY